MAKQKNFASKSDQAPYNPKLVFIHLSQVSAAVKVSNFLTSAMTSFAEGYPRLPTLDILRAKTTYSCRFTIQDIRDGSPETVMQPLLFHLVLAFGFLSLSPHAFAQSSGNPNGPRFVQPPTDDEASQNTSRRTRPCETIGQNVVFCPKDSGWILEAYPIYRPGDFHQNLYQRSENERAAITAIFMREGESRDLSFEQLENFADAYTFTNGPRGPMTIETVIQDWSNELYYSRPRRIAIVVDENSNRYLLTVDVYKAHYGFVVEETTLLLPEEILQNEIDNTHFSLHEDFGRLTGYKFSAGL